MALVHGSLGLRVKMCLEVLCNHVYVQTVLASALGSHYVPGKDCYFPGLRRDAPAYKHRGCQQENGRSVGKYVLMVAITLALKLT
jgi:hypothetical protein